MTVANTVSDPPVNAFGCDLCDETWDRDSMTFVVLRTMVGVHLWVEHALHSSNPEHGDHLPMNADEIAWVRAQRNAEGLTVAKVMCGRIADPNEPDGGGMDLMVHRYPPEKGGICECGLTFDDHIGSSDDPSENPPSGQQ